VDAASGQRTSDRELRPPSGLPPDFGHGLPAVASLTHDDGEHLARISGAALAYGGPGSAPDERPVHATGVYARGFFIANPGAGGRTTAAHLQAGVRTPVLVRFSNSSPTTPRDDRRRSQRGMAVRFEVPSGEPIDMVAMDLDRFHVRDRASFESLCRALGHGHQWGRLGGLRLILTRRMPPIMAPRDFDPRRPRSYSLRTYDGINTFVWRSAASDATSIRYRWRPTGDDVGVRRRDRTPTYLRDELRGRLERGVATTFALEVQDGDGVDPRHLGDATRLWKVAWEPVGTLTLERAVDDRDAIRRLDARSYSPLHLGPGIEAHPADAILALRAAAYPAAHVVRTRGAP
jgi:catalase